MPSKTPMFPANREQLTALAPVLGVTCVESKAAYEKTKGPCTDPSISDVAGAPYRKCSIDTFTSLMSGECKKTFDDLIACNKYYEYDYGKKCKQIRQSLLECAVKNGMGEIGK